MIIILGVILGIILGIPYLAIGFILAAFAFDNPPGWIEKYHLTWLVFIVLMLIGPVILLGAFIWYELIKILEKSIYYLKGH